MLPPARLAEVLAIFAQEFVGAMPTGDRSAVLERVANRLDGFSRAAAGSDAGAMLGAIGIAMMRLEN